MVFSVQIRAWAEAYIHVCAPVFVVCGKGNGITAAGSKVGRAPEKERVQWQQPHWFLDSYSNRKRFGWNGMSQNRRFDPDASSSAGLCEEK